LIIAGAAVGLIAGPRIRASVFFRSTEPGQPPRRACPACAHDILPDRWPWRSLLPVTGRCPSCRARIGPYPLLAELAAGLALAIVAARVSSGWELAALAWLALLAIPLAFIDVAVHRLPDPLTAAACIGTLALLAVAALTGHQPGHLGRAAIGAAALACFYLAWAVIRPGGLGLGDAKLATSVGAALAWVSWRALPDRYGCRIRAGRCLRRRAAGPAPGNPRQPHAPGPVHSCWRSGSHSHVTMAEAVATSPRPREKRRRSGQVLPFSATVSWPGSPRSVRVSHGSIPLGAASGGRLDVA